MNAALWKRQNKLGSGIKTCFLTRHLKRRRFWYKDFRSEGSTLIQRGNAWQSQRTSHRHLLLTQTDFWQELSNCSGEVSKEHFLMQILKVPENRSLYHDGASMKLEKGLTALEKETEICCYVKKIWEGGRSAPKITEWSWGSHVAPVSLTDPPENNVRCLSQEKTCFCQGRSYKSLNLWYSTWSRSTIRVTLAWAACVFVHICRHTYISIRGTTGINGQVWRQLYLLIFFLVSVLSHLPIQSLSVSFMGFVLWGFSVTMAFSKSRLSITGSSESLRREENFRYESKGTI